MPKQLKIHYIKNKLPVVYRYHQGFRWFMILLSFLMIVYSLYFMFTFVGSQTPVFYKVMPLIICFVGLDSILRKITSLNSITFLDDKLIFGFIAKRNIRIPYDGIQSLDLLRKVTYYMLISYHDEKGRLRQIKTPASFPHVLEVIFNVADLAKSAVIPEKMQGILDYLKENADSEI